MNRRNFIHNSLILASCAALPVVDHNPPHRDALERLITALSHQCSVNDAPLHQDELQAMTYAYNQIKPQNHLEYAVVIVCASRYLYDTGLIDEYVQRKNGNTPKLFHHHVFDLEKRGMPNTYGLLLFKEQAIAFLQELTSSNSSKAAAYWLELIKWKLNFDDFVLIINDQYKRDLGTKGLHNIYDLMRTYTPYITYCWSSVIVTKAGL
jgi:hypothetical protein